MELVSASAGAPGARRLRIETWPSSRGGDISPSSPWSRARPGGRVPSPADRGQRRGRGGDVPQMVFSASGTSCTDMTAVLPEHWLYRIATNCRSTFCAARAAASGPRATLI